MKKIDMSEAAILRRLKQVDQLRELCLSLMKAKKIHDEKSKNVPPKDEKLEKRDV
jgi:DNA-binding transcriptional MerR regulator